MRYVLSLAALLLLSCCYDVRQAPERASGGEPCPEYTTTVELEREASEGTSGVEQLAARSYHSEVLECEWRSIWGCWRWEMAPGERVELARVSADLDVWHCCWSPADEGCSRVCEQ